MKIISIIWESFNRYDVANLKIDGFSKLNFTSCSGNSAAALYLMQTAGIPDPDWGKTTKDYEKALENFRPQEGVNNPKVKKKFFSAPDSFIANFAKTRLISIYWPHFYDTSFLDPRNKGGHEFNSASHILREPENECFVALIDFLKNEFYQTDYQHLIYWSMLGHGSCGNCRVDEENHGVPITLEKTASYWLNCLQEHVFPLIDFEKSILIMHNDHGTSRKSKCGNPYTDGFIWLPTKNLAVEDTYEVTWSDIRKTLRAGFEIDDKLPPETGKCLLYF